MKRIVKTLQTSVSDVSLWKKSSKKHRLQRSNVIDSIVQNQRADYLGVVVQHGWDVNEMLQVVVSGKSRVKRTALHHAVYWGWHEGVRLLLNACADCNIKCQWSEQIDLSRSNCHFTSNDRLQRGWRILHELEGDFHGYCNTMCKWSETDHSTPRGPGYHLRPRDMKHTPMCVAILNDDLQMVKLLIQNVLDFTPEDTCCGYVSDYLHQLTQYGEILDELLTNGKNVRRNLEKQLQRVLQDSFLWGEFCQYRLDVLFTHGTCIDPDYQGSTLYHAFERASVNTTRWLIRHGALCPSSLYHFLSQSYLRCQHGNGKYLANIFQNSTLPMLEIILQVGTYHSDSFKGYLGQLRLVIQGWLHQENDLLSKIRNIYSKILFVEKQFADEKLDQRRRQPFPTDRDQQMAHLREFSDNSLDVYPDTEYECWEQTARMISNMLYFLNQPHTLQWHCRVCLRESLVSLSPSVIRTLPVPAALKCYILCHEI